MMRFNEVVRQAESDGSRSVVVANRWMHRTLQELDDKKEAPQKTLNYHIKSCIDNKRIKTVMFPCYKFQQDSK